MLRWLCCLSKLSHEALPCSLFVCVIPSLRPLSHICATMCVYFCVCTASTSVFGALNSVHGLCLCVSVWVSLCASLCVCVCCNQCVIPSLRPLFHTAGLREPLEGFCAIQASFALSTWPGGVCVWCVCSYACVCVFLCVLTGAVPRAETGSQSQSK